MLQGQYVDGRYKIIKSIGSGGMANVYLAQDLILERPVAIKLMRYDFSDNEVNMKRFQREARASTELNHKNIVSVYDLGEDQDYYIVMEYIDGPNLKDYIAAEFPIPHGLVINLMGQILEGVAYAHSKGIIHRDLKPQNILINSKQDVKITDFGIAVALSKNSITQTNSVLGSVQYISPEQAKGAVPSPQSDIYSLGIILYEMLTKELPYDGESAVSIALQHFQKDLPSLTEFDPQLPQALENVVIKATAKDPKYRYQTAEEMRQDLLTSLYPERLNEAKYIIPSIQHEETIKMEPIKQAASVQPKEQASTEQIPPIQASTTASTNQTDKLYQEESSTKKKRRRRPWWLAIPLIAIFSILFFYLNSTAQSVKVPEVMGMTLEQAQSAIEEEGLRLGDIKEEHSDQYERGQVSRTSPAAHRSVRPESEIDLFISQGQEEYELGDYTGREFEEVEAELSQLGFNIKSLAESSADYPAGVIIGQDLEAGSSHVPDQTSLTLTVSTGPPTFSLRDLSQYSWQGVVDYAEEMGLSLSRTDQPSNQLSPGLVLSQYPQAGTELQAGDHLSVVISSGPEEDDSSSQAASVEEEDQPVEQIVDIPYQENEEGQANEIDIYIEDKQADFSQAYRSFTIEEDTTIRIRFDLDPGQEGAYRIVRDGEMIEEGRVST